MTVLDPRADVREIAHRGLVPTERQLEEDDAVATDGFAPPPPPGPSAERVPITRKVGAYIGALDPRTIKGPKLPIVVFSLLALFTHMDEKTYELILPELRAEFGGDIGPILFASTALPTVTMLVAPMIGFYVDRIRRVRLVKLSQIGTNVATFVAPLFGRSVLGVTLYRGGAGLLGNIGAPTSSVGPSLMADYYEVEDYSRVVVFLGAIGALGGVLAPLVAGYVVEATGGWRPAVILLGLLALVFSLPTLFLREPKRGAVQVEAAGGRVVNTKPPTVSEALRAVRSIATLRRMWLALIPGGAALLGLPAFLALFWAQAFGLTPAQRGVLLSISSGAQFVMLILATPFLGRVAARKPGRVMVILGAALMLMAPLSLLLTTTKSLTLAIVVAIPLTAAVPALLPALSPVLLRVVPADVRAFGFATISPFLLIGNLLYLVCMMSFGGTTIQSRGFIFVPLFLIGGYLFVSIAPGVDRDTRAAEAATLARMAFDPDEEAADTAEAFLVCRDVEVQYGGTVVLDGVDLDVRRGEILALLGTNGAGKSTLLKVICGLVPASNGAIFFGGRNITHEPTHLNVRSGIVMVPGGRAVFPTMTVRENLTAAQLAGENADGDGAMSLDEIYALFPVLVERIDQRAGDLSGGEQQMVALAQALMMRPDLLMIDELSLGLAPGVVEQLLDVLTMINDRGTTIILVEQSVNVALTVAERAVFMDKGRVHFDGPTPELLGRPDLVRAVFMGGVVAGSAAVGSRAVKPGTEGAGILRVDDVTVDFGGVRALEGVSISADSGAILGILGPNGAGKTTLFDVVSGFVSPTGGAVTLDGTDVTTFSPDARAELGLVRSFQDARLFPSMTVRENIAVAFGRLAKGNPLGAMVWSPSVRKSEERIRRRVDGLIDLLNLGRYADLLVGELSTGSRRAVDVAVVMAADPKVLLLDEPSSGLAQAEVEALGPVITRLARDTNAAIIVIEHDLPLLGSISNRLVAMERGQVVAVGDPEAVMSDRRVLASYLNASESVLKRSGSPMSTIAAALGAGADTKAGTP